MRERDRSMEEKNRKRRMEEELTTRNMIEKFDKAEQDRVNMNERLKQKNLNDLQQQIAERKARMLGESKMNAQEI